MTKHQRALYFAGVCTAILAICVLLFAYAAHADTPIEIPVTISPTGYVTFNCSDMPALVGGNIHGFQHYSGSYPSGSVLVNNVNPLSCSVLGGGYGTLEGGYVNGTVSTPDGNYWVRFAPNGVDYSSSDYSGVWYYFRASRSGGVWKGPPSNTNTHIVAINQPTEATTTYSNTVNINFDVWQGTPAPATYYSLRIESVTATNTPPIFGTLATTTGYQNVSTTTTLANGSYTLWVGLWQENTVPCTWIEGRVCPDEGDVVTKSNIGSETAVNFSVVENQLPGVIGWDPLAGQSRTVLATTTCSVLNVAGCFQNALVFLFYPDKTALDQFGTLWQQIEYKKPFGYVVVTITSLHAINASSTDAFTMPTLPLMNVIFTPLRVALSAILWLVFALAWYHGRLKHLDI